MWSPSNQRYLHTLNSLKEVVQRISRMISHITNSHAGIKEHDTLRLVKSLVITRVTYSLSYQNMRREEKGEANGITRMTYKTALRVPQNTPSDKLLALGLHNNN